MVLQPNPPLWPASVQVFNASSTTADITAAVNAAYALNGGDQDHGQFSEKRYAFLFGPGTYSADVPVGYYTQVLGLGEHPDDTVFTGDRGVFCEEANSQFEIGALDTFWRSAENFHTKSAHDWTVGTGMIWAVSQAAPLRRVHIDNQLVLFEYKGGDAAGYGSGGFLADSKIGGPVTSGSQQQWFTRNVNLQGGWVGGIWNMVYSGVMGAPNDHCGNEDSPPVANLAKTSIMAEKPFLSQDPNTGLFDLNIPQVRRNSAGPSWEGSDAASVKKVNFSQVYVTSPTDTAAIINARLNQGLHVVVTPAIYHLTEPIVINRPNTVLLCLGMATLKSVGGNETIVVGNVDGVRVGGCLLEAGAEGAPALLRWGTGYKGNAANPGFIYDLPARVGGPDPASTTVSCDAMVVVNNGHVIGDNLWLWRADHTKTGLVKNSQNPVYNGLVVRGDNVQMYGLAVEHVLHDGVRWEGENGLTVFYQCELPYDVTPKNFGSQGYTGYRVTPKVTSHQGVGFGVYTYFRDTTVEVETGIVCPAALENSFKFPMTRFLNGYGGLKHVINKSGGGVTQTSMGPVYVCKR